MQLYFAAINPLLATNLANLEIEQKNKPRLSVSQESILIFYRHIERHNLNFMANCQQEKFFCFYHICFQIEIKVFGVRTISCFLETFHVNKHMKFGKSMDVNKNDDFLIIQKFISHWKQSYHQHLIERHFESNIMQNRSKLRCNIYIFFIYG